MGNSCPICDFSELNDPLYDNPGCASFDICPDCGFELGYHVIQVGASGARIILVGPQRIEYINIAGQEQFIELKECSSNWVRWFDDHRDGFVVASDASEADIAAENARCVGIRGGYGPFWVQFMNEQKTRFEFDSYVALAKELLGPLREAGWGTWDSE